jgi:ADP-ribose pyrophosphatase YjhB (NUDIX family)
MQQADTRSPSARPLAAAGALFFDTAHRVMLVEPTYKDFWDIPGGYINSGETPSEACKREIAEELGLDVAVGRLLVADWAPNDKEGDKILFIFEGGALTDQQCADIRLQSNEIASYEFVDVDVVTQRLIPRLARRVAAAVAAHQDKETVYLEHGLPW